MTTPFASCTHAHTQRTGGSSDLPTVWGVRWGALAIGVRRRGMRGLRACGESRRKGGKQRRLASYVDLNIELAISELFSLHSVSARRCT